MNHKANETAQQMSIIPFRTVMPSVAPLSLLMPTRSSVGIHLVAPKFQAELAKERTLAEKKRKEEERRYEQRRYASSQQPARQAVFQSD